MKSESREVDRKVLEISLDELQAPLICSTLNRTEQRVLERIEYQYAPNSQTLFPRNNSGLLNEYSQRCSAARHL